MDDVPIWLAVVGIAVPILVSVVALGFSWRSDHRAAANNRIAQEAKDIAKQSNQLAQEANDIARQSLQAEHQPLILTELSKSIDFVAQPHLHLFLATATNQGKIPVMIESVGIASTPPPRFFGLLSTRNSPNEPFVTLPYELVPGRKLVYATELDEIVRMLEVNRPLMGDDCWVRFNTEANGAFDTPPMNTDTFFQLLKNVGFRLRIDRANGESVTILGGELGAVDTTKDES